MAEIGVCTPFFGQEKSNYYVFFYKVVVDVFRVVG